MKIRIVVKAIEHGYGKYFSKKVAEFGYFIYFYVFLHRILRIFLSLEFQ